MMRYISTRGGIEPVSFTEAVAMGLAPDGGLLLPKELPDLRPYLQAWEALSYPELAEAFFRLFATDLDAATLARCVGDAYSRFSHPEIAPLHRLDDQTAVLELFHGPTLAFKDFALQLLGNFYEEQIRRTGRPINVLGATSGDTGAAAIHGLLGKEGVHIFILYPDGKVAPLQERQMVCVGADNVDALAIRGSFDDAQNTIKELFGDLEFRARHNLSAINSINLARVLAQCVYYLYAWFRLPPSQREVTEFIVPTGNFGNVLAGWLVQRMGVGIRGFCVATNRNDILYRLFETGEYQIGEVAASCAPSMDIQIASNFERFLYYHEGEDSERVRAVMQSFKRTGAYTFSRFDRSSFRASRADDARIVQLIREVYQKYGYIVDPHTACGFAELRKDRPAVILGTAHPAKFPDTIADSIGQHPTHPTLEALKPLPMRKHTLDASPLAIRNFIEQHAASR